MLQWNQLVHESNEQLAARDIAEVNLACAADLPGCERIDPRFCIRWLDASARAVGRYTERYLPDFWRKPEDYENSEAYYRALCLITVLQRDCGVRYNPEKIPEHAIFTTEDVFIHGVISGKGGTCASLPVIYAAVGRRLGYPIKLVQAPCHFFCRWQETGGKCFNIEANCKGMHMPPDDHFLRGRYHLTPGELAESTYLKSQTPREELAGFLAQRAYLWLELDRHKEAADSFIWAASLSPDHKPHGSCAVTALDRWDAKLKASLPPNFPCLSVNMPPHRRYPDYVPRSVERQLIGNEARERLLQDPAFQRHVVKPLAASPHDRPPHIPRKIVINVLN